jgi:colanic acid biosynthesis glycosyl transferase WcaI
MHNSPRLILATQFYPPDTSTTAVYLGMIAETLSADNQVVVVSATPNPDSLSADPRSNPVVVEIRNWNPRKSALVQRAAAVCLLAARMFFSILRRATSSDVVVCITSPFTLPYTVLLAAKLRGAMTLLLIHDLYPEALEAAGLIHAKSFAARLIRFANTLLFRSLDAIIVIGRDVPALILKYPGVKPDRLHIIPNWPLIPIGYREIQPSSRFRAPDASKFIVGLSGNLGFTHSPATVFEAARLLQSERDIHFILSGWGVGWKELNDLFAREKLTNITILSPVPEDELIEFLSAADLWVIPYRRNVAGVSIPSRLYNLLAVGRPVVVASEANSEGALVLGETDIGWVVPPEDAVELARAIQEAARDRQATTERGMRAASVAHKYRAEAALALYRRVVNDVRQARIDRGNGRTT